MGAAGAHDRPCVAGKYSHAVVADVRISRPPDCRSTLAALVGIGATRARLEIWNTAQDPEEGIYAAQFVSASVRGNR
jgi:hypothetical protein